MNRSTNSNKARRVIGGIAGATAAATALWLLANGGRRNPMSAEKPPDVKALELRSSDFEPGGIIPKKYTCDGEDVSPELTWGEPPARTVSFALIADDPDAPMGTWVHWVAYDLPASARGLPRGVPKVGEVPGGGRQGINDFPRIGYGGPCPPPGKPHRYFFKLHALDTKLGLEPSATKKDVERAMRGHILAQGELMGRYGR